MPRRIRWALPAAVTLCLTCAAAASSDDDLASTLETAARVDELLAEEVFTSPTGGKVELAALAGDEAFLRRLTLDLAGTLPSPERITLFVLDPSPDKRAKEAKRLLADPRFGRNWGRYWRDVIFYRRSDERALLAAPTAEAYLADAFNAGTPWDKLARSFIEATGDVRQQGSTALIVAQVGQPEEIAAEASRVFLGVQIQCAQCHDHPTDRWKRQQFHELAAFFPRIAIQPVFTGQERSFEVVSHDRAPRFHRPGGMGRRAELEHYMPDLNDPGSKGTLVTPAFFLSGQKLAVGARDAERRGGLAGWMTSKENPWFARAFVNRLWSEMVGEGFYEPVDDLGPDRDSSAPRTLEYLAGEFALNEYDVKWLFATIAATQAYQRESRPRRNPGEAPFAANSTQRLRSDQVFDVLVTALGGSAGPIGPGNRPLGGPYGLGGPRFQFAGTFGYDPSDRRDEITGSIPQALLLMNSPFVQGATSGRNPRTALARLLAETADNEQVTVELYLRTLARQPNKEELAACLAHVRKVRDRAEAFEDIFWALINRTEFLHRN